MEALGTIKSVTHREEQNWVTSVTSGQKPSGEPNKAPQSQSDTDISKLDKAATEKIVEGIQEHISSMAVKLNFQVHDDTGVLMVRVIREETGEVVREIPPERILDLAAKMDEMVGALFDAKT